MASDSVGDVVETTARRVLHKTSSASVLESKLELDEERSRSKEVLKIKSIVEMKFQFGLVPTKEEAEPKISNAVAQELAEMIPQIRAVKKGALKTFESASPSTKRTVTPPAASLERRKSVGSLTEELSSGDEKYVTKARLHSMERDNRNLIERIEQLMLVNGEMELRNANLQTQVEQLTKQVDELKFVADRNAALYQQLIKALDDEGIDVQITGNFGPETVDMQFASPSRETCAFTFPLSPSAADSSTGFVVESPSGVEESKSSTRRLSLMESMKREATKEIFQPTLPAAEQVDEDKVAAEVIAQNLKLAQESLPDVRGFLYKKSPTLLRGWQRRFFFIADYKLLYIKDETIPGELTAQQMAEKSLLNTISLLVMQDIVIKSDSPQFQFEISARDPRTGTLRSYLLRADTAVERERWVNGLNAHREHLLSTLRWAS